MVFLDLLCESCGFATPEFMALYFAPGDFVDVVFQSREDASFRILRWENVSKSNVSEAEFAASHQREGERYIGQAFEIEDDVRLECPECHQMTVRCRSRGIV